MEGNKLKLSESNMFMYQKLNSELIQLNTNIRKIFGKLGIYEDRKIPN